MLFIKQNIYFSIFTGKTKNTIIIIVKYERREYG